MKFTADANISYRLVAHLRSEGHDVVSILEEEADAADGEILARSFREHRTVITYDKDFGELVFRYRHKHHGVILLRVRSEFLHTQRAILDRFIRVYRPREIKQSFWVVSDTTVRRVSV